MSRNGKIARLPRQVRTEINQRLDDGQEAESILAWLNELPFTQEMLEEHFEGVPISAQNLSERRQGGFREWEFRREIIEQACSASDFADDLEDEVIASELAGRLAALLAARYAALLGRWNGDLTPDMADTICVLRGLNKDIALLQKTLHQAQKQKREQEKAVNDEDKFIMEEEKKRETAPINARFEAEAMELALGGGAKAKFIAQFLAASKYDLPPPRDYQEKLQKLASPRKAGKPQKPAKPAFGPGFIKANQTQSR
jgi:hypothetical protein